LVAASYPTQLAFIPRPTDQRLSNIERMVDKLSVVVVVKPSDRPVYVKEKGKTTKLFLRTGNATNELAIDDALEYYKNRWG